MGPTSCGAGCGKELSGGTVEDLMTELRDAYLVVTSNDRHLKRNGEAMNEVTVYELRPRRVAAPLQPYDTLRGIWDKGSVLFTDGSLSKEGTLLQWASGIETVSAAAGVYVAASEELCLRMAEGVDLPTAHAAETLALAVAVRGAAGHDIHSDCAAALAAWGRKRKWTGILQINKIARDGEGTLHKVKAHAERTKPRCDWTPEELGNVIADATAAGDAGRAGKTITHISATAMRELFEDVNHFLWYNRGGKIVFDGASPQRMLTYLHTRDHVRALAEPPRPPRWQQTTYCLASKMWATQGKEGIGSWARAVRIMWDKHLSGENEAKWGMQVTRMCDLCGVPSSQKHLVGECRRHGMDEVRARALRKVRNEAVKYGVSLVGRTLSAIVETTDHPEGHTIWTGMWTPSIREQISRKCPWTLKAREYGQVTAALRHLVNGLLDLIRITKGEVVHKSRRKNVEVGGLSQRTLSELWRMDMASVTEPLARDDRSADDRHFDG
jgi:hypothetical protein